MYTPFHAIKNDGQLWRIPRCACPIENKSGKIFTMQDKGLVYVCTIRQQGDVTVRQDTVQNISSSPITFQAYSPKLELPGGDYQVYTQLNGQLVESDGGWQPLVTQVQCGSPSFRACVDATPFMALWNRQANRGMVFHVLVDSTWQLTVSRHMERRSKHTVQISVNFYENRMVTLQPGQTISLPGLLFYACENKVDLDCWKLHKWFADYHPRRQYPVTYNSWLYRFDRFTPEEMLEQIPRAQDLGVEYFVIDAGWFGTKGNWTGTLGDWTETKESAMEGRLAEISQAVRDHGMKFGLWFEIERAAPASNIVKTHPEYYVPGMTHPMLNFTLPEVREYILELLEQRIRQYHIEYLKFDMNADICYLEGDESLSRYFVGYREVFRQLKQRHPEIYLECCASGGLRMDIRNAMEFDSFWMSDNMSPYHDIRIYKDSLKRLPPQVMDRFLTVTSQPDFLGVFGKEYLLSPSGVSWSSLTYLKPSWVEGMLVGAPIGLSCDLTRFSPELHGKIKDLIAQMKENREFWMKAQTRILCDTEHELVLQHADEALQQIHIMVYSGFYRQAFVPVYPVVDENATYTDGEKTYTGKELATGGLMIDTVLPDHMNRIILRKV